MTDFVEVTAEATYVQAFFLVCYTSAQHAPYRSYETRVQQLWHVKQQSLWKE